MLSSSSTLGSSPVTLNMHILNRLQKAQKPEGSTDRVYDKVMADILAKCMDEARAVVQSELDKAKSETAEAIAEKTRAEGERDAAKTLQEAADKISEESKGTVVQLRAAMKLEQTSLAMKDTEITDKCYIMQTELTEARSRTQSLEIEVAELKGKLSQPKQVKQAKQINQPIPQFDIGNVIRGADDRIVSATITPVRLN